MPKRFASIWFRHLLTDWKAIRQPGLKGTAYVFAELDHGRMLITPLWQSGFCVIPRSFNWTHPTVYYWM